MMDRSYSVVLPRIEDRTQFIFRADSEGAVAMNFDQFEQYSEDYDESFYLPDLESVQHVVDEIKKSKFFVENFDLEKIKIITWWS